MKEYRKKYLIFLIFLITLNLLGIYTRKCFVLNISSSIPIGIYKVDKSTDFKRGDIITFSTKNYSDILNYSGSIKNITFSKYIAGISGDYIRIENNKIYI
ncbi:MAG: S26 family signal peptidase, partial [Fusobacterium sp.]|nr:S26 family signal peptidase [Fusobacterium sp.]